MDEITPILGPIKALFQSRKFLLALIFIILAVITHAIPDLSQANKDIITNVLLVGLGMPFLHLSIEDIITTWKMDEPLNLEDAVTAIATEIISKLLPVIVGTSSTSTTVTTSAPGQTTVTTEPAPVNDAPVLAVPAEPVVEFKPDTAFTEDATINKISNPQVVTLSKESVDAVAKAVAELPPAIQG